MTDNASAAHILILAAGSGTRFGGNVPKQYCLLRGRPVLMWTVEAFRRALPNAHIVLVISAEMHAFWRELCAAHKFQSPEVVYGGATRVESSLNGLRTLKCGPNDAVLIHDGARPLVDKAVIENVLRGLDGAPAVIPAIPVTDTLRVLTPQGSETVDRSFFRAVQTPQGFRYNIILEAFEKADGETFTDDASMVEALGYGVQLVEGSPKNIKLTTAADMIVAEAFMSV